MEAIKNANLDNYKDFGRIMAVNQTGDDYEAYSVIRDNNTTTRSEMANLRSKSARIPKGYSESEVKAKKQNYFGKTPAIQRIENLGFAKDFLEFDGKNPALLISNKNDEMDVSKRYENVDFSKLQELDFTTNRPNTNLMNNLKARDNGLNVINEVTGEDYETFRAGGFGVNGQILQNKQPQEENLLDL